MTTETVEAVETTPDTTIAAFDGWAQVVSDDEVFDGEGRQAMSAVTVGGPGFVAVGRDQTADSGPFWTSGAVWTSPDGLSWTRSADEAGVFSAEAGVWLHAVAAGGPGLVAVGNDGIGAGVWTSSDGTVWDQVPDAGNGLGEVQEMRGVVAGGPGLVAVGQSGNTSSAAAVWTSPDGFSWTRSILPSEGALMNDVIVGGPGLIAVGLAYDGFLDIGSEAGSNAAVWTSPDGIGWTRVPYDEAVFGGLDDQLMEAVTAGGPGFVAVGQDYNGDGVRAAVWTSSDGVAWVKVPSNLQTFGGSASRGMWGVAADGADLVAVGATGTGSGVWTSVDGAVWTQVPQNQGSIDADGGNMHGIAVGDSRLVAVGQLQGSVTAMVWSASRAG